MRWRMSPTMRLMRMPAPTKNAERPVLVSPLAGTALGLASRVPAPTCSRVSPATSLAGFSGLATFTWGCFIWASERVVLHLVEKRFVTDAKVFGGLAFVAEIRCERSLDFAAFDETQDAMGHIGKRAGEIEFFECFVVAGCGSCIQTEVCRFEQQRIRQDAGAFNR